MAELALESIISSKINLGRNKTWLAYFQKRMGTQYQQSLNPH